ncbi:SRPBCC family protein [Mycobacterium vicinigordonae]|uniref:SRPBCC family protein n=1 Tax=Mycobacterium vicinigordonae TaxID=1719132 RepID=A0A7D6I2E0_9MYCO|nr:SRPBCC family protein [Mycobacterium vicinigordonae]QLL05298.1 SRPBCC family protein [Mycobacterium vicinigordonae]
MSVDRFVATRTIAASPAEIFAVLSDPARHHSTEPGDWVRDAVDSKLITGNGQLFAMNMHFDRPDVDADYVSHNLVTVYERESAIAWMTGQLDDAGNHRAGGWFWRYDLAPDGDGTEVRLTYDWSATPQEFRDEIGGMPPFAADYLDASLASLERAVTS